MPKCVVGIISLQINLHSILHNLIIHSLQKIRRICNGCIYKLYLFFRMYSVF